MSGRPALLDQVLAAAGGEQLWRATERISARVRSGGLLMRTRVPGTRFADYRVTVETARPHTILDPFPEPGLRGVFDRGAVRIESADGRVHQQRSRPRELFSGRSGLRRNLRWDALDSTYFAGYAMWNYLVNPLLLIRDDLEVSEGQEWSGEGARWRRLDVRFPPGLDSHSPEQSFYYDDDARLVRHDYTAEVIGSWARAGHYCDEHRDFEGLSFPTRRRVLPLRRNGRTRPFPVLVSLELSDFEIGFAS